MALLGVASAAIPLFYLAGLTWRQHTHLAIAEYWRWWVVHLWVEGFFEVFATVVIAFLFSRLGLFGPPRPPPRPCSRRRSSSRAESSEHATTCTSRVRPRLRWPGAVFSALEVVPLVAGRVRGVEEPAPGARAVGAAYKWPIYFFVAVAFWNMVGAGLFGFMINPPIALYYMQGLNTTPVHGHAALFGVYGMLGIGLMLFCLGR